MVVNAVITRSFLLAMGERLHLRVAVLFWHESRFLVSHFDISGHEKIFDFFDFMKIGCQDQLENNECRITIEEPRHDCKIKSIYWPKIGKEFVL